MIERKTVINQITALADGHVLIQFVKTILEDGKVIASEFHRTSPPPDGDVNKVLAIIDDYLGRTGAGLISDDPAMTALTKQTIATVVSVAQTKEAKAKYEKTKADNKLGKLVG